MSEYGELWEACLLDIHDADRANAEWPDVTPMKAQRIALSAIEERIVAALEAKDREIEEWKVKLILAENPEIDEAAVRSSRGHQR